MSEVRQKINIGDIADALGVSKTTVSRAISGKGRIGAETRNRVMSFIDEHNYMPNVMERGLAKSRTHNLALIMPSEFAKFEQPFCRESLSGVYTTAAKCDYDVILCITSENDLNPVKRIIENEKVDGCILFQAMENDDLISYLKERKVPFVLMGKTEYADVVQIDNKQQMACEELTNMLILQEIRNIALLGGNVTNLVNKNRYEGFKQAFEKNGMKPEKSLLFLGLSNDILIERAAEDAVARGAECIVCMDDMICIKVLKFLDHMGLHVPKDVKVASFYDSVALRDYPVSITALNFDAVELGSIACRQLLDILDGRRVSEIVELGYQLVLRESTKKI